MDVLKEQINNETQMDIVFCSSFVVLLDLRQIPFSSVVAVVFVAFYFILFFNDFIRGRGEREAKGGEDNHIQ